jgi:ankyrin repeat protein
LETNKFDIFAEGNKKINQDKNMAPMIHYCVYQEDSNLIKVLKELLERVKKVYKKGTSKVISKKDKSGNNPFHYACYTNSIEIIEVLLKFYEEWEEEQTTHPIFQLNNAECLPQATATSKTIAFIKEYFEKGKKLNFHNLNIN